MAFANFAFIKTINFMLENNKSDQSKLMQAVLTVKEKTYLTPHYIRIVLEGNDVSLFAAARIGDNNISNCKCSSAVPKKLNVVSFNCFM